MDDELPHAVRTVAPVLGVHRSGQSSERPIDEVVSLD